VNEISADTLSTLVAGQGFFRERCNQLIHMFQTMHESSKTSNSGTILRLIHLEPSMRKGPIFGDAVGELYVLKDDISTVESSPTTSFVPVSSFVKNKVESSSLGPVSSFLSLVVKGQYAQFS
ncbi:hypothetical protein AABB24_008328, partial [Solanum stoloniferum]